MSRADALLAAVAAWEAAPPDPARDGFLERVAQNARAIAERDGALGPPARQAATARMAALLGSGGSHDVAVSGLAEAIQTGALAYQDPALLDHLRRGALDDLAIEQPRYRHGLSAYSSDR